MNVRLLLLSLLAALAGAGSATERIPFRVLSAEGAAAVIDRGSNDLLRPGDAVLLVPREGSGWHGVVTEVSERTAVVRLDEADAAPAPGMKGEILVPAERFAAPAEEAPPRPPEHPPWRSEERNFDPSMPLLADRPVRPEDRPRRVGGRAYAIGSVSGGGGDRDDVLLRAGVDAWLENPFGRGDRLHLAAEAGYLTETDEGAGLDLLVRRFSYSWGGTRFSRPRIEVGRFLQQGIPEFGVLDGVEWGTRTEAGHLFGASAGWMPEPDDDFDSFADFQVAAFYEWVSDPRERVVLSAGFQKSWHDYEADRDLLVARFRWAPGDGWSAQGSVSVDFYTGGDAAKESAVEVTQALLLLGRRWENEDGVDLRYSRYAFPEILRNEFPPIPPAALTDDRYDELSAEGWHWFGDRFRLIGLLRGYADEFGTGGSAEAGAEWRDGLFEGSRVNVAVTAYFARFEDGFAARASLGSVRERLRWSVLYEFSNHHLGGVDDARDDLLQHRVRASASFRLGTAWDVALYGEVAVWDETSQTGGFSVSRRF